MIFHHYPDVCLPGEIGQFSEALDALLNLPVNLFTLEIPAAVRTERIASQRKATRPPTSCDYPLLAFGQLPLGQRGLRGRQPATLRMRKP